MTSYPNPELEKGVIRWSWQKIGLLLLALFLVAAGFDAINFEISRKIGRLSTITNYDDVTYLNTASKFYFQAKRGQLHDAVKAFLTEDTHSPVSVFEGMFGYLVFGFSYYKVYYALMLVVFAYLGFVAAVGRRLPLLYFAGLLLASLAVPLATMAALEFRPDPLWAIVLGGSCVLFLSSENAFASWRPSILFGAALGFDLLTKPSTFAMTLIVFGGTWFLVACIALAGRLAGIARVALGLLLTVVATLAVCGWYCIPHAREIFDYFYINSFGANKDVWVFKGTVWDRLLYYVSGTALQSNLAWLFLPLLALYVFGAFHDILRSAKLTDRLRGGAFLWMLGCLYLVNGLFSMKSPFLGGSFYGFLIFGGLWYLARLLRWCWIQDQGRERFLRWRLQGLTALSLIAVAWAGNQFPDVCKVNMAAAANQKTINRALVRDLLSKAATGDVSIMLTQGNPVISEFIEMEFRQRGTPIQIQNLAMVRTLDTFLDYSKRVRFVILQDQKLVGAPGSYAIPGEKLQPELLAYFQKMPDWKQVAQYHTLKDKRVYLFERAAQ